MQATADSTVPKLNIKQRLADFNKLWFATTVSVFGGQVTNLAIPLAAVTLLGANAMQMGWLRTFSNLPFPLFSLLAGVWLDRVRRKPVMITANLVRAVLLFSVPLAAALSLLTLEQLYVVVFCVGTLTVIHDVAHFAYVPALVTRKHLIQSNSKLHASHSLAELGGPGLGGLLVQWLGAPFTVLMDGIANLGSALAVSRISTPETAKPRAKNPATVWQDIVAGLHALFDTPALRSIIIASMLLVLFNSAGMSIYLLYLSQDLQLSAATIGLVFAASGGAAMLGAALAAPAAARIGVGPAIILGWFMQTLGRLAIPFAGGWALLPVLFGAHVLMGVFGTIANIHQWTFRQNTVSDDFLARVTAGHRFAVYGTAAVGSLLGGVLGTRMGLHPALVLCAALALLGPLYALLSPLRTVRKQPGAEPVAQVEEAALPPDGEIS
ncbi:MAG: MFS transporter [Anaerolineales bacterium]|nr:MFS transporter [Anaerolineales bacterium]